MFVDALERFVPELSDNRLEVVAAASAGRGVGGLLGRLRPELALVEVGPAGAAGPDVGLVRELVGADPALPVAALCPALDDAHLAHVARAGARALLPRATTPTALVGALLAMGEGWAVLPPTCVTPLCGIERPDGAAERVRRLGAEDRRLLCLLATGASTERVAAEFHVSGRTVKRRVSALLRRLRVSGRAEAALVAGRAGLVPER
ncbi:helix-turn-helix transcriptional regulator, partial [Actinoalloteichus spitiensis]|uniref:helix-turn-helix transcriptional regulator n=1 Tax=Actinoalloteichus spitiensis TaxID=252394 RepID=UPI00146EFA9D